MKKNCRRWLPAAGMLLLFCLFTLAVAFVDVRAIGPNGGEVGFAAVNGAFARLVGVHMVWYELTELLGLLPLLAVACFALAGLVQLVKGRSLKKVDREILLLGALCVVLAVFYVGFEVLALNFRPVLMDGVAEPSYPSSHTMLFVTVLGAVTVWLRRRVRPGKLYTVGQTVLWAVMLLGVVGRVLSGVHWLTDIVGSLLLSAALVRFYDIAVSRK